MLEAYFEHPFTLRRLRSGPSGPHVEAFADALRADGYAKSTMRSYLRTAAHFARWARDHGIEIEALDEAALLSFEGHLPTCQCLRRDAPTMLSYSLGIMRGARRFLAYLRRAGIIAAPRGETKELPALIERFEHWMRRHRGVKDSTLRSYRVYLIDLIEVLGDAPADYDPGGLRRFLQNRASRCGRRSAKRIATATRMFLRCLAAEGRCDPSLADAIPRIADWSMAFLPRYLPAASIDRLIASCDTETQIGMRDQAILLLLARLGLRPSDVAHLRLDDIDWVGAKLRVTGKGRRESWLPLSQEVGDSILRYLEQGRPINGDDHVFLSAQAPIGPFRCSSSVGGVVRRAVQRSGVKTRSRGAYILRHSAATEMLRQGASLGQIGVVLRHRSVNTTAIYAKVDVASLRAVAQAWPLTEVSPC